MRTIGRAKGGFYPTPEKDVERILELVEMSPDTVVLDPCAGDGRFLHAAKEKYGAKTCAVELNAERASQIKADVVYEADALTEIKVVFYKVDVLFLNPPYDWDTTEKEKDGKSTRTESLFLRKYLNTLKFGGVVILVYPFKSILDNIDYLKRKITPLAFYNLSDEKFDQVVLIGVRGYKSSDKWSKIKAREEFLPEEKIIPTSGGDIKAALKCTTVERFVPEINKKIISGMIKDLVVEDESLSISPIMPPREGHLALLAAAGVMNGEIEDGVYIRGSVRLESIKKVEEGEENDKTTEIIRGVPTIEVLDTKNGVLFTVK